MARATGFRLAGGGRLPFCRTCLQRRQVHHWGRFDGAPVLDAVRNRARPTERFAYLEAEAGDVHLVRLRPTWVHEHEEPLRR